jgi:hypothetical protein
VFAEDKCASLTAVNRELNWLIRRHFAGIAQEAQGDQPVSQWRRAGHEITHCSQSSRRP